jgi:hypothetical protein
VTATEQEVVSDNGVSLNGVSLNGVSLNGVSLNGVSLNGTSLDAAKIVGSKWSGQLSDGSSLRLRIDAMMQGAGANADLGMYAFAYRVADGWRPLCGVDGSNQPILALAVSGTWDTRSGVVGGVRIRRAIRPSRSPAGATLGTGLLRTTLARRVSRNGCGSSRPRGMNGARCISKFGRQRFEYLGLTTPSCLANGSVPTTLTCGLGFESGTLLINRLPVDEEGYLTQRELQELEELWQH